MAAIRSWLLVVAAAVLGVTLTSLVLYQAVERASFVALFFALPGTALVATSAAMLTMKGVDIWLARLLALLEGLFVGALILWLPGQISAMAGLGATYGGICAATWIALDLLAHLPPAHKRPS